MGHITGHLKCLDVCTEEDIGPLGIIVVVLANCYGIKCHRLAEKIASNYLTYFYNIACYHV